MGSNTHRHTLTQTYHTGLGNRVSEQNKEDAQNCSDLDGEAARLTLKPEKIEPGHMAEGGGEEDERVNEVPVYLPRQHFGHIISQEWK